MKWCKFPFTKDMTINMTRDAIGALFNQNTLTNRYVQPCSVRTFQHTAICYNSFKMYDKFTSQSCEIFNFIQNFLHFVTKDFKKTLYNYDMKKN